MFTTAQKLILAKFTANTEFVVNRASTGGMFLEAGDVVVKVASTSVSIDSNTVEAVTGDILTITPAGDVVARKWTISDKPAARKSSPDRAFKSD